MAYKPKGMNFPELPEDVYNTILDVQVELKKKHTGKVSMASAVYKIIREYAKIKNSGKN